MHQLPTLTPHVRSFRAPSLASVLLGAALVSTSGGCTKPGATAPAPSSAADAKSEAEAMKRPLQLAERESLPDEAREMLHGRMLRHGDQLVYLVTSVLLLDYASTARLADALASEPRLGRPTPEDKDTLNALLPPAFFKYQDALTVHARELAAAARKSDDAALAETFAAVTKTCVGCHSVYLDDDLGFPLHDEHDDGKDEKDDLCDDGDPSCSGVGTDARLRERREPL